MKKRILLTGSTGFVGSRILAELLKDDVYLRLVVRTGSEYRLPRCNNIDIVRTADVFDESPEWWTETCRDINVVIHAAWYTVPGDYVYSERNEACVNGTLKMADGCSRAGIQRFIGIGSCAEYDLSERYLSVTTPLRPTTPYGIAKVKTYLELTKLFSPRAIEFIWARLFYLFGEGEDGRRLVPYIKACLKNEKEAIIRDGEKIRDYLDVLDAAKLISSLAFKNVTGPVNICSGSPITIRQIAENIADKYGRRDLLRFDVESPDKLEAQCVVGIPNLLSETKK